MGLKELFELVKEDVHINFGPSLDAIRAILLLLEVRWEQFIHRNCYLNNRLLVPIWYFFRFTGSIYQWLLCNSNIPGNSKIGKGLWLPHPSNIIVVYTAEIGEYCTIYQNSTVAINGFQPIEVGFPKIGDQVMLGTNSVILGDITIGSNVLIGAGTVITRSIPACSRVTSAKNIIVHRPISSKAAKAGSREHISHRESIWLKEDES